jgi:uncharacterized protein with von Willebrand factor type A (vWA) domain
MVEKNVLDFIGRLREAGIQVSVAESIDSLNALKALPLDSLRVLRASLKATLAKQESDFPIFDAVFDEYFTGSARALAAGHDADETPSETGTEGSAWSPQLGFEDLSAMLRDALVSGSDDELSALASMVADGVGQAEGGFGGGGKPLTAIAGEGYYMFRAFEWLGLREIQAELEHAAAEGELSEDIPPVLVLEELKERYEKFRRELEREVRRRLAGARGDEVLKRQKKLPSRPEEVDFTSASLRQVEEMRRILPALARKLAARLARKKSAARRGRVDIRNTLRHSLSSGGVPIDLKYKKRIPSRPELFILCDVSGSVRTFSTFTLQLVYSLHQQFRTVRSFAFIDRVDEVTDCFNIQDVDEAVERAYRDADVVDGDGHSDVGRAIDLFYGEFADDLSPRSTVLILGDARNNGKDPRASALERISERTRRVYWLNPEPRERWDSGDSVMSYYERHCHSVHECRNLKQLAEFVYRRS